MTTLTKLDKQIKEYQWLSHKVIEGIEALKQENRALEAKSDNYLQEWCRQAVECQELEKEIEKLKKQLANLSNRLNT